jgi:hypothetical protein
MEKYFNKKETEFPIYKGRFVIILTNDDEKILKHLPEHEGQDLYAHTYFTTYKGEDALIVLLNPDNPFDKITAGVVAHEATHVATALMTLRGINFDAKNDEPMAYLVEWVVDEIINFMLLKGKLIYI